MTPSREERVFRACFYLFLVGSTLAIWTATSGPAYWLKLWILEAVR